MSDFLNPLGGRFIGPSGPVATSSVLGTVPDPPRGFGQLDPGTIIRGVVLGRESDGLTAIATDKGTIRVASNALLPAGVQVTLEVRPTGDRLQVLILANDAVQRGGAHNTAAPAGMQTPTAPGQPTTSPPTQPTPLPATSAPGSETHGHEPRAAEARAPQGTPPTPAPARADQPSIQFIGSSVRAVVVQATALPPELLTAPGATNLPAPGQPPPATTITAPPGAQPILTGSQPSGGVQPPVVNIKGIVSPPGTTAPPAPSTAQGTPLPNVAATTPPAATISATTHAALIAATVEKKNIGAQLPPALNLPPKTGVAPPGPDFQTVQDHPTDQAAKPEAAANAPVPASITLPGDTRQRILALFNSAAATLDSHLSPAAAVAEKASQVPVTPKTPTVPLPLGAELKLRVLAVQMQAHLPIEIDPIAEDAQGGRGQVIFGRVVSITPAGHAVIHTPVGDIMLQNRSSLPAGARLALTIDTLEAAPPPAAIAVPMVQTPQQALLTLAKNWPTLADLIAIFQGSTAATGKTGALDPEIARQALAILPHAGNKLGAGMLNAMAAFRSGDIGKLLGPLLSAKGAGEREELVRRLHGEFAQLSTLAQDRPEVDWRALFLPVIDDQGRVSQINLFYRRPKKGDAGDRTEGSGTRFVVEADFSRLGPFQLDGLMHKQRFDLMVRSRTRLTDRMRLEIEAIYEEARGLTGFSGGIAFQTVDEFPVIPLDELKRNSPTVTV